MDGKEIENFLSSCTKTAPYFRCVTSVTNLHVAFQLYKATTKNIFVVNTSGIPDKLGHWVLVYVQPFEIVFFDSFGRKPLEIDKNLYDFLQKFNIKNIKVNSKKLQQNSSCTCPAYVIFFSVYLSSNFSLNKILSWFSATNLKLNDSSIFTWLQKRTTATLSRPKILKCAGWKA